MSSEAVMLDMMSMLTLLNSGKEEEEVTSLKHLDAGSKVDTIGDIRVGTFEVKERDVVLIIGILSVAFLGLILVVVAGYFFRKMVNCYIQKRREQTFDKNNQPTVLERV